MIDKVLLVFLGFAIVATGSEKKTVNIAQKAEMLVKTIKKYHYKPRPVDDSLSSLIFDQYLRSLDPYGCYLTQEIVNTLEQYRYTIDEQITSKKTNFVDTVALICRKQFGVVDSLIKVIGRGEIILTQKDTFWLGGTVLYEKQSQLLKKLESWTKYMVAWSYESQRDSSDSTIKPTKEQTAKFLEDAVSWEQCKIQKLIKAPGGIQAFTEDNYLKAIANAFDPHTDYLSPDERVQRKHNLSKSSGSFGIDVNQNMVGEIEIITVEPGSPAWLSNKINEGDIILAIKINNNTSFEMRCTSVSEVQEFLNGVNHLQATFKIRKKTGTIIDVPIKKALLDVKQNTVRGYVLKQKNNIGYIYLPSFYTEFYFGSYFSQGCASDLTKELLKLKSDSISGLILDLRGNGGGLVVEALRIAGLFIDYGGLGIIHERGEKPSIQKDNARGTIYDGPLVVLVNSSSASASELLAAVLQDHNRALIAGSTTFGKGTMQSVIPADAGNVDSLSQYKGEPPAYASVTTGALYRVTGQVNQSKGVTPDIFLPDLLNKFGAREISFKSVLQLDTIIKKVYYYPLSPLPVRELMSSSARRIKGNQSFQYIRKKEALLPDFYSRYPIPLELERFIKFMDQFKEVKDSLAVKQSFFTALPTHYESLSKTLSANEIEIVEKAAKDITEDLYINEAFMIINDLISISAKGSNK